jgi:hypothetical protein
VQRRAGLLFVVTVLSAAALCAAGACTSFEEETDPGTGVDATTADGAQTDGAQTDTATADVSDASVPGTCTGREAGVSDGGSNTGLASCGGSMFSLGDNVSHCGACFHACVGPNAACSGGLCKNPVLSGNTEAYVHGARNGTVFWTRRLPTGVWVLETSPIAGGGATISGWDAGAADLRHGAVTETRIYLTLGGGRIQVLQHDGGAVPFPVIGDANENADAVTAVDGDRALLGSSTRGTARLATDASVQSLSASQVRVNDVAASGSDLFWVRSTSPLDGGPGDGGLVRHTLPGGAVAEAPLAYPEVVTVDADYIYVWDRTSHRILRFDRATLSAPSVLATFTGTEEHGIAGAVLDDHVYFFLVNGTGILGVVLRVHRCGGDPLVIWRGGAAGGLAVASKSLFAGVYNGVVQLSP